MSFANKLRQVVAANFVEISRPDTSDSKGTPKPKEPAPEMPEPPAEAEAQTVALEGAPFAEHSVQDTSATVAEPVPTASSAVDEDQVAAVSESPVAAASPAPTEAVASDPMAFVNADGTIEFDQVFARSEVKRSAGFTAEQALSMLHSMPSDLPLRVKRLTVKATLDAVGQAVGATPKDIVNDAGRKVETLESFIREVSERAQEMRNAEDTEIEHLRARIAEREAEKLAITQREEAVFSSCRSKIEDLDQVVAFFTVGETEEAASADVDEESEGADGDELPAYLQEDAVKRLLGLHGNSGEGDSESDSTESDKVGTASRSRTRR